MGVTAFAENKNNLREVQSCAQFNKRVIYVLYEMKFCLWSLNVVNFQIFKL